MNMNAQNKVRKNEQITHSNREDINTKQTTVYKNH